MSQSGNRERLSGDEFQEAALAFSLQSKESGSRAKVDNISSTANTCQLRTSLDGSAFSDNLYRNCDKHVFDFF